jgi:DNA-binding transcriptional LysR family regulator
MRDELSGLSALLAVAEQRSFTAAAARLGITPSAVSQTVAALEQRLGVRLLQRTTRSVGLTEAGARFVTRLRPALGEVRSALEALSEQRDQPAGTLRLTVHAPPARS